MWNLKINDTTELIYKTERNSQAQRISLWLPGKKDGERGSQGDWDGHVHTALFKMDNQQGPTTQHRELCSMLCNNLNGNRI